MIGLVIAANNRLKIINCVVRDIYNTLDIDLNITLILDNSGPEASNGRDIEECYGKDKSSYTSYIRGCDLPKNLLEMPSLFNRDTVLYGIFKHRRSRVFSIISAFSNHKIIKVNSV